MQIGMGFGKFLARVLFQELGVSVPSSVFHVLFITRSLHAKKGGSPGAGVALCVYHDLTQDPISHFSQRNTETSPSKKGTNKLTRPTVFTVPVRQGSPGRVGAPGGERPHRDAVVRCGLARLRLRFSRPE
jgi:hypothetical protein